MKPVNRDHPLAVKIRKQITQALSDYNMIAHGDKVMICVSGGKDSSILTILLEEIRKRAEIKFTIAAVILDQKQPGFDVMNFKNWLESEGIEFHMIEKDTYSVVKEKVTTGVYCSLCSKMRRAILYDYAFEHKYSKMALGHHRTDLIETTMLNMFYTGNVSTMPAKLRSDDGRNIVIRPMMYVAESDLIQLATEWGFPVIPCNLCGSQEGMKRKKMKNLISELEKEIPNLSASFITALQNVKPSHLLDKNLYDFEKLP
ncbi:tRNA 2-thiocytidine(32) synthetase TtcA [Pseudobdellovibrio sp. HCB154]|uniref:tRNA 2-thiocytidine(32) synthetase TtcA n=1 Tax=Pseudobdellovibrio sp. HCB154 TaxID=3386277 RepID=UPI003916D020